MKAYRAESGGVTSELTFRHSKDNLCPLPSSQPVSAPLYTPLYHRYTNDRKIPALHTERKKGIVFWRWDKEGTAPVAYIIFAWLLGRLIGGV